MNINVLDAKTNLSKLLQRALDGEEIVLARNGVPAVRLVPVASPKTMRPVGIGRVALGENFTARATAALSDEELSLWS